MIDVHCHLDLYSNPIEIANECEKLDIYTIGVTNLPSHFVEGAQHLRSYTKVRLALGMHPLYASRHKEELDLFSQCIDQTSYVGEIGLDFSKEGISTKSEQIHSFEFVLNQLQHKCKIISLHSREAERDVFNYLLKFKIKLAIFHWYTGPLDLIDQIVKAGYMFSINPAMIKSNRGRNIIDKIPLTNLLTESDGPFIQLNGRSIKPSDLNIVENYIADKTGVPKKIVQKQIVNNFMFLIKSLTKK